MKTSTFICIAWIGLSGIACKNEQSASEHSEKLKRADWLLGTWEGHVHETYITEIWEKGKDAYWGRSYSIRGEDTTSSERIRLQQEGNILWYISVVKNQNEGKEVRFMLTSSDANQLVFQNPEHDFPKKIKYTRVTNDSLFAEISGFYQGEEHSEKFPMRRAK